MDTLQLPQQLPSPSHHVIVVLEQVHLPINEVDTAPQSHELICYHRVSNANEVRSRIQCASIVIATQALITAESLGEAPYLKCIITPTVGTNHIDMGECRHRGIKVAKCEGSTSPAVADHALSLYFAARRKTVMFHNDIRNVDNRGENSWKRQGSIAFKMQTANGSPPLSVEQEVVGIIGHGHIEGKRLETFCNALGMKVLISDRKNGPVIRHDTNNREDKPAVRTPFEEVIRSAIVLFLSCTFDEGSCNMIDAPELSAMRPEMIIINVSRGGAMRTSAVVQALQEKRISGAGVDAYDQEPASTEDDSRFLAENTKDLNLTFSPHTGYFSTKTILTMKSMVQDHISHFISGDFTRFEK
ncbi:D-isomer specific 2-hydroxyacid dehydrogenase [Nemania serpens]|nr:D-isomer specific 2-hydroxyacid dehydrogenase [Nemania serpens]